jgi:DNA-binding GntR family transcriptional regulator
MRQTKSDGKGNHFQPLTNTSLRSRVSEILRESIFSGKLQSGDPLKEIQLARQFQVSQSTVRESLLQLEHDGLVVRVPNRESRVTKLSTKEVCERLVLRSLLEGLAGVEASRRMKEGDFRILEQECEKLSRALEGNDYYKAAQADLSFHRFLWKQSGN